MVFEIVHRETLVDIYTYEADSKEEAIRKYQDDIENGRIDYSDMELEESIDTIHPEDCAKDAEEFSVFD